MNRIILNEHFFFFTAHSVGIYQPPAVRKSSHSNGTADTPNSPSRLKTNDHSSPENHCDEPLNSQRYVPQPTKRRNVN